MEQIGIDLGAKHSHIVVMTSRAEVILRTRLETPRLPQWLEDRAASRVVMEACTQSPAIARASTAAGPETFVVPATSALSASRSFAAGAWGASGPRGRR